MTKQTLTDLLDQDDKEVAQLIKARTTVAAALDRKNLLEVLREIVDKSACFDFASSRSRRFISAARPELTLVFDREKVKEIHPNVYSRIQNSKNIDEQRDIRKDLVRSELSAEIVDFFTAAFKYIMTDEIPEGFKSQEERVLRIISKDKTKELRESINNIFEIKKEDGTLGSELGFVFSIVTATSFPADEEIFENDTVYVEVVY